MKLVHVTTVPQSLFFLRGQVRFMKTRGFEVAAVAASGPALERFGREEGIPTHSVEMARRITPFQDLVALARLTRVLRTIHPAIVQSHTPKGGLLGMIAAFLAAVPVRIYTLHGLPLETARGLKREILRWTEKISCCLASQVVSVGPSVRRSAIREGLAAGSRVKVVGRGSINGVDASGRFLPDAGRGTEVRREHGIPAEAPVIGFVGRLVRDKGLDDLMEAWKGLRQEFPDLHLLVVGEFEPQDPISPEAECLLRSDPRIHWTGEVEDVAPMYGAMNILALPTYREGFPTVPLEAAAMSLPVVATRVTGCVDAVLDGVTGTLVEPGEPDRLREALRNYLRDPGLASRHGHAGRERVLREFGREKAWESFNQEYHRLLSLKKAGPAASGSARPSRAPRRSRRRPIPLIIKRTMDVAASLLALILLSPLIAGIALLIRMRMGSPVFFRQRRPGEGGRPFTLLKFRTMVNGNQPDAERLTAFGRQLRATSLDELPQLWNVLRGDMSLVGPRPLMMQYLDRYSPEQARRHDMKPGVTGWAQVQGRNALSWEDKFKRDLDYVDRWSLPRDLWILILTVGKVFSRAGIEASEGEFMGTLARAGSRG